MAAHTVCCGVNFWVYILIIVLIVLFAGLMSGLTLGLMSLGLVDLEVLMKSGTASDRKYAGKVPHRSSCSTSSMLNIFFLSWIKLRSLSMHFRSNERKWCSKLPLLYPF
jgi:hypothetical protein